MTACSGESSLSSVRLIALLTVIVAVSVAIHGYHYGIEDEAIYLPAIKAHLNPALYPHDADFFVPQTRATLFDELVATTARGLHLPVDEMVFVYYLGTLLAFYIGLWALVARLFTEVRARLCGVLLVASLLTLPVAGTSIYLVDQHLHPRTLATALILVATSKLMPRAWGASVAAREYAWAALFMMAATLIHLQMAFYGSLYLGALVVPLRVRRPCVTVTGFMPALLVEMVQKGGPEWQEAARTRAQHYMMRWEWYEWLGAIAPVFLLWGMAVLARRRGLFAASAVATRTALFTSIGVVAGCVITIPPQLERLTAYQPMRILHLTYLIMFLLAAGLFAELVRKKLWLFGLLLLPIAAGMSCAQFQLFSNSRHIELPGRFTGNDWVDAFNWVKTNTPVDAYFVLDPHYMSSKGEDYHGFRALAERGQLADWEKDSGVALLFPGLSKRWSVEVHALDNWQNFGPENFHQLHEQFGVGWTIRPSDATGLEDCPYRNRSVAVCKIE